MVSDDGLEIRLALCADTGGVAAAILSPVRAVVIRLLGGRGRLEEAKTRPQIHLEGRPRPHPRFFFP